MTFLDYMQKLIKSFAPVHAIRYHEYEKYENRNENIVYKNNSQFELKDFTESENNLRNEILNHEFGECLEK